MSGEIYICEVAPAGSGLVVGAEYTFDSGSCSTHMTLVPFTDADGVEHLVSASWFRPKWSDEQIATEIIRLLTMANDRLVVMDRVEDYLCWKDE